MTEDAMERAMMRAMGPPQGKMKEKAPKAPKDLTPAHEAVTLHFIHGASHVERAPVYRPEYLHQVFDDEPEETIRGHVAPRARLYFAAGSLLPFIAFSSEKKLHSTATDVVGKLKEWYPANVATANFDDYLRDVERDEALWRPPGEQFGEFTLRNEAGDGEAAVYQMFRVMGEAALAEAMPYHERIQAIGIMYIDGMRLHDGDPRWEIYYIARRVVAAGETSYQSVGYCTVYPFYHHPDKIRARICQFLVLPPFQRKTIGSRFYEALMADLRARPEVLDVTVEDPAAGFQAMRDLCDYRAALPQLPALFADHTPYSVLIRSAPAAFGRSLKLSKRQSVRICEIAAVRHLPANDPARAKELRLAIKRRLFKENEDELDGVKKRDTTEFFEEVQTLYDALMAQYRATINSA